MLRRLFPVASVALLAAAPVLAEPTLYACRITKHGNFFADEMVFSLDEASGEVMVVDPIIMYYNSERAIPAELSENTASKVTFKWDMPMTNSSGQTTRMKFRAVVQKPSMRLLISARPAGFSNVFSGRGACASTEAEIPGF